MYIDLIGQKFGRLTVIGREKNNKDGRATWRCNCDCGNETIVLGKSLRNGNTRSCGCLHIETAATNGKKSLRHGMKGTSFYNVWRNMKKRCFLKTNEGYKDYGGRGITVCDRWLVFDNFKEDMYEEYLKHLKEYNKDTSIDRINVNGNYEPSNCRWATMEVQSNNKRNNVILEYNEEKHTVAQWARILNMSQETLYTRIFTQNMSIEDAFFSKNQKKIKYEINGESHTFQEWSKISNIKYNTIMKRHEKGWGVERAVFTPA